MSLWEIREEEGSVWIISTVIFEVISFKYSEGSGGVNGGFHKFLKKDRKGEKLFVFV